MKKTAFLFPGQGSQNVGMGKALCDEFTVANEVFNEANDTLGFDLKKLCFEGDLEELTKTVNTQPALLTHSVAAFRVFMQQFGITPDYSVGHSLGEISALTCAGAIQFSDALKLVRKRGTFMQEAVSNGEGAMAAVSGIDKKVLEEECKKISTEEQMVVLSNCNSPDQIVISGHKIAVVNVSENLKALGGRVVPLKVSAPFHSPLMMPAAVKFNEELKKYAFDELKWPVISNVTAMPYNSHLDIMDNLTQQIVKPVEWQLSMEYMGRQGVEMAVELGPQTVLKNLMKKNSVQIMTYSFDKKEDADALKQEIRSAMNQEGSSYDKKVKFITKCIAIAVCTRNKNWNNDEYQKGVVEPYRKVQQMLLHIEETGEEPAMEQVNEALTMLQSVFTTKMTSMEEQNERFEELFHETDSKEWFPDFEFPIEDSSLHSA